MELEGRRGWAPGLRLVGWLVGWELGIFMDFRVVFGEGLFATLVFSVWKMCVYINIL